MKFYAFDAYGTLFDVHSAVRRHAERLGPDAARLSEIWRNKQLEYTWIRTMSGTYVDFWTCTEQALDFAFAAVPSANKAVRDDLMDAYMELDCYDEVASVLKNLRESGAKTSILSNGTDTMLDAAIVSAGLDGLFDAVLSVDKLGQYKTVGATYQLVCNAFSCLPEDVSFQSSNRWDIAGATRFGFRTIWVNRTGQPDEYPDMAPAKIVSDLSALTE